MTRLLSLCFVLLSLATAGCGGGLIPFTHELRVSHGLRDEEVKNLQFYVSHRITLRRELSSGSRQITGGHKLLLVSGKTVEEVVIEAHTPGVAVDVRDDAIAVSFEPGSSLWFSAAAEPAVTPARAPESNMVFAEPPEPFPENRPGADAAVAVGEVGGSYWLSLLEGKVAFQKVAFAAVEDSARAHLLIDAEKLDRVVEERKVLPGVRLSGRHAWPSRHLGVRTITSASRSLQ